MLTLVIICGLVELQRVFTPFDCCRAKKELPPPREFKRELWEMEGLTNELGFRSACVMHGDFHGCNILYDRQTGEL